MHPTLRQVLRHSVLSLAGRLPRTLPRRLLRIFYGHAMEPRDLPAFRANLRMLRDRFEFVSLSEAVAIGRSTDPPDGRFAAFTFDDGYIENNEYIAPTLRAFGATACVFVSTNFVGCDEEYRHWFLKERALAFKERRPMSWEDLRELAGEGFEVGAHTLDHYRLSELSEEEALQQALGSKAAIERETGCPCDFFSWPFGYPKDISPALVPQLAGHFKAIFSGMRSRYTFSYDGKVFNRDHFEPGWPTPHVRFFATRPMHVGGVDIRGRIIS